MRKKTTNIDITKEVSTFLQKKSINIENKTLMVALSSGIDSSVLLNVLIKLKDKLNFNIKIAHVNYNLRGDDSIKDRELAKSIANNFNIDIYIKEIEQGVYNKKNLQNEARIDRYTFFKELYEKKLFDYLVLAHHKDDLAETIIYRILKGSGTNVYKAMKDKTGYIIRPLINTYREEIKKYAIENNIEYREDISNTNNKYKRNKIRNLIMPMLIDINKNSKSNIINFAEKVYEESKYINKKSNRLYKSISISKSFLNIDILNKYNDTIKNIIIKKFMFKNKIDITTKRIYEIKKIITSNKNYIKAKFENIYLIKKENILSIEEKEYQNESEKKIILSIEKDGIYNFYDKKIVVESLYINDIANLKENKKIYMSNTPYPITIRSKMAGDVIIDNYTNKKLKLKKLFIDLKIKKEKRHNVPVIEKDGRIIAICFGLIDNTIKNRISKDCYIKNKPTKVIAIYLLEKTIS